MKDNRILKLILKDLHKLNEEKKKLSKKQKKIAQAAPPPDEITAADFKALNKKSEGKIEEYPAQYKAYGKRRKDLDRCTKLYKDGKTKEAAACRQKMEKPHMKETGQINELNELLNDMIYWLKWGDKDQKKKARQKTLGKIYYSNKELWKAWTGTLNQVDFNPFREEEAS